MCDKADEPFLACCYCFEGLRIPPNQPQPAPVSRDSEPRATHPAYSHSLSSSPFTNTATAHYSSLACTALNAATSAADPPYLCTTSLYSHLSLKLLEETTNSD